MTFRNFYLVANCTILVEERREGTGRNHRKLSTKKPLLTGCTTQKVSRG